ncbi:GNAT family N-acetyltransferase [Mycolicibacterium sp. 018/SC-01/001]|uniref:GNAT family N-acetyltransferase n=1 Tax=Mycolicibacterium sp. 018/SC-01/001 TaxID=2592069 RepID=UPI00117EE081|nr:GNAT family N-acetyltransferase [Mycolicibacterium sp. 018/SC-01/001]TRW85406.1 GNAT family N-acetyltransferase [Mycolicibacterium sp. 018/SC-01/001]
MGWTLTSFAELEADQRQAWSDVRDSNPALDSPYFHPAFAGAVHEMFGNVQVAVDDGHAWFPVQVHKRRARPVGWPGADFQGPVAAPGASVDLHELVSTTGLHALTFDHFPEARGDFTPWVDGYLDAPFIDVTGGLDGYVHRIDKASRDKLSRVRRMTNKATRQLGEVRLVWDVQDPRLLDWLIDTKRSQYATTGAYDYFAMQRRRDLIHHLARTRVDGFAGILSAVYAGETLLAAHFGLRDRSVLHWWFPVFDRSYAEFAPGWILLRELISAAPQLGLTRIDLGPGDEDYKRRAMTGSVPVAQGEVTAAQWRRKLRTTRLSAQRTAIERLKDSPFKPTLSSMRATAYRALAAREARR